MNKGKRVNAMFGRVLAAELMKTKRSLVWVLVLIGPLLTFLQMMGIDTSNRVDGMNEWETLYTFSVLLYAMLFLPLLTGVLSAFVCRFEHLNGGWKQVLALPVSRSHVYLAKLLVVAGLLGATQSVFLLLIILVGVVKGIEVPIPWDFLLRGMVGGWIAALPLAALQMWVSVIWRSFGAPLALNVVLTLPAVLIANSETFGPFYPWAQPLLAMSPQEGDAMFNVSLETLFIVMIGGFLTALIGGWWTFVRRDVTA